MDEVIDQVRLVCAELRVLPTVLDLFFKYEWHNFLHNLVKNLFDIVITGEVLAHSAALWTLHSVFALALPCALPLVAPLLQVQRHGASLSVPPRVSLHLSAS